MSKWSNVISFLLKTRTILWVFVFLALVTTIQNIALGSHTFNMPDKAPPGNDIVNNLDTMKRYIGSTITHYNNYIIFKQSWYHLIQGKNLYIIYPSEYWDLYKYSPTFSVLFAPLAYLPDFAGLLIWNLINSLVLFFAIRQLPFSDRNRNLFLAFILIEQLTSIQNEQSNALLAGLLLFAYISLQKGKVQWASLWLVLATLIKVYGAIGFCLFLFYPGKIKFIAWSVFWSVLFFFLPVPFTPFNTLIWQYHNWATLLAADQSTSYGLSVMGWLHSWFGIEGVKTYVTLVGIVLFLLPLARWRLYKNELYRLLIVASMLIWVIIFNHKAESPTFVIAMAGVGVWYFSQKPQTWRYVLLFIAFLLTTLSVTDIFPHFIKDNFFTPYTIKVIPCIILWCVILKELMTIKAASENNLENGSQTIL